MAKAIGFKRFFVLLTGETAMIDPEFSLSDKLSADDLCSSMRSNIYSYSSSAAACERASEQAMAQIAQGLFDSTWSANCSRSESPPLNLSTPLNEEANNFVDENVEASAALDTEVEPMDDLADSDESMDDTSHAEHVEVPTEPGSSKENQDQLLDEVLRRNPESRPASSENGSAGPTD